MAIPTAASAKEFETLVGGSIVPTEPRKDQFGLPYPRVRPIHSTELQVNGLGIRSAVQYAFQSSGYIVEITLDRLWDGPDTRPEPQYVTSVALFHPQWDHEMESLENRTEGRNWKRNLSNFFQGGFGGFIAAIQTVQELLIDAANEVDEEIARARAAQIEADEVEAMRLAAAEAETELWVAAEVERQAAEIEREGEADTETQADTAPSQSLLDD